MSQKKYGKGCPSSVVIMDPMAAFCCSRRPGHRGKHRVWIKMRNAGRCMRKHLRWSGKVGAHGFPQIQWAIAV